jgi:predicted RNase H-like HicB family nuclease
MNYAVEFQQEQEKNRWLAVVPNLPGVMVHGKTPSAAGERALVQALRVLADQIESGKMPAQTVTVTYEPQT